MDALIMSCGTGGGHNAAGTAIAEELNLRGHHAVMINPYSLCDNKSEHIIDNIYPLSKLFRKHSGLFTGLETSIVSFRFVRLSIILTDL